ncbi:MAG TPA: formylglycine-generating enzyme family protein [Candidatus Kapabacteria bacterium]|jgi:hypothetical protein|nr:formylglycine-generating enzyme family protein [Candidatus Kapabacteria bacterium]HOM04782.1 formylglycine-generating enzyme family protein [Candidatus Kapabacteria bacterium]HOQ48884.1 formylglycine-generating enzyme family protein [Candidatus Kapabacteria bacterium]
MKFILYILIFLFLFSCDSSNDFTVSSGSPKVTGISKNITFPTDTLVIYGRNFPFNYDSAAVIFNDSIVIWKKNCLFWRANSIGIIIDEKIPSGHFIINFGKDTSEKFNITVLAYPPFETTIVNPGAFKMGSTTGFEDELPVRNVYITKKLEVSKTEVTQRLYEFIAKSNPSTIKDFSLPVYNVSWLDGVIFCNKLSEKDGLTPAYSINDTIVVFDTTANGWRLPTEAEWEYLARAGSAIDSPTNIHSFAWFVENSGGIPKIGANKLPNAFGLYDMLGNVSEWCWDLYAEYNLSDTINPIQNQGSHRIHRGGCFLDPRSFIRFSSRRSQNNIVGIRLVRNK